MVRSLFLLIHFLVVQDYELPKTASRILSVPLTLECVRILDPSLFSTLIVSLMMFYVRFCALNSSCDKRFDLSQQVEIAYMSCNLILKI